MEKEIDLSAWWANWLLIKIIFFMFYVIWALFSIWIIYFASTEIVNSYNLYSFIGNLAIIFWWILWLYFFVWDTINSFLQKKIDFKNTKLRLLAFIIFNIIDFICWLTIWLQSHHWWLIWGYSNITYKILIYWIIAHIVIMSIFIIILKNARRVKSFLITIFCTSIISVWGMLLDINIDNTKFSNPIKPLIKKYYDDNYDDIYIIKNIKKNEIKKFNNIK